MRDMKFTLTYFTCLASTDSTRNMADQDEVIQEETVAKYIPFAELSGFLEKVQRKQGNENKKAVFKSFLEKWREFHKELHKDKPNVVCTLNI